VREKGPLGVRRLVDEVRAVDTSPLRGVALFAPVGTTSAVMAAENPMSPTRDTRRKITELEKRVAASSLPYIVALAVGSDTVNVYPATTKGHLAGAMVAQWRANDFHARSYQSFLALRLTVLLRSGEHHALETKYFRIGPNKSNWRTVRMIVQMGRLIAGEGTTL
jgi:hypothetical protein